MEVCSFSSFRMHNTYHLIDYEHHKCVTLCTSGNIKRLFSIWSPVVKRNNKKTIEQFVG